MHGPGTMQAATRRVFSKFTNFRTRVAGFLPESFAPPPRIFAGPSSPPGISGHSMSKIRDKIMKGEPATGTVEDLGEWLLESIRTWTPEQKAEARKDLEDRTREEGDTP